MNEKGVCWAYHRLIKPTAPSILHGLIFTLLFAPGYYAALGLGWLLVRRDE